MKKTTSDKQISKQLKVYQTQVAVQHVQENAKYYAQLDQPYSVGWGGKSLFANSPRDLVNQILKIEN